MSESADSAWPLGPTVIDKTDVPSPGETSWLGDRS